MPRGRPWPKLMAKPSPSVGCCCTVILGLNSDVLPDRPGIRGRVLDCKGQPADGFVVGVAIAGASDVGSAPTGGGGLFVIPDLGAGDHRLMVTRPGAQGILVEQVVAAGSDDVVLRLPIDTRASGEARGRFLDANGRPFAPFAVISTADGFPQTLLIADGGFRAVELAVGEYELFAEAEGYQFLRHRFRVEADKVVDLGDLSMRAAACLSVRVLRPDGSPWRDRPPAPWLMSSDGVRLQKGVDFRCRESGAAIVFDCLPGGRYIVQVPDHDGLATLPVEVDLREGGALRIDLPTAVGFRRTLVFATSFGADRGPIAVELRRSGEPVVNAMAFATALAPGTVLERSLPPADYEVTGVDAKGGRYRAQFAVRGGADSHVVPVPRVE